jgi:hypothetical protein
MENGRSRRAWGWTLLAIASAGALLAFGGCVSVMNSLGNIQIGRRRLDPIPVPRDACRYLTPIRDKTSELKALWQQGEDGAQWPGVRARIVSKLPEFERLVEAAQPHVPVRIRTEFETVVSKVEVGRVTLPATNSWGEALSGELFAGLDALANASDLVGTACGEPLYTGFAF